MKKKFFIGLFIFASIGLFIFAHIVLKNNSMQYTPQQNLSAPIEIPDKNIITYEEAKSIDKPIVMMFYVDWCTYCRKFMPVFGEMARRYKDTYSFTVINCDNPDNTELLKVFHISGFPTLFLVDKKINHKFTLNMAGTVQPNILKEELDDYLDFRKNIVKNN